MLIIFYRRKNQVDYSSEIKLTTGLYISFFLFNHILFIIAKGFNGINEHVFCSGNLPCTAASPASAACYWVENEPATWMDAWATCSSKQATLAVVDSKKMYNKILAQVSFQG